MHLKNLWNIWATLWQQSVDRASVIEIVGFLRQTSFLINRQSKNSGAIATAVLCMRDGYFTGSNEKSRVSTMGSRRPPLMRAILRPTVTLFAPDSVPSGAPSGQSSR